MTQTEQQRITELETTIALMTHACRVVFAEMKFANDRANSLGKILPLSHNAIKIMAEAIGKGDEVLNEKV